MGAKLGQNNIKGEQTKLAILAAAEEVFAENGYRGSSLLAVAERAGVTQSGLLHHFRTKEDLLQAVLAKQESRDDALLRGPLSGGGAAVVDGLTQAIDDVDRVAVRLFALLAAECTAVDHPGHDYMREHYARLRQRLVGALAVGGPWHTDHREVDVEALASALIATMDGLRLQWIYDSRVDMGAAFDIVASLVRGALRTSTPAPSPRA